MNVSWLEALLAKHAQAVKRVDAINIVAGLEGAMLL
jgi:hypothetical protein